MERFIVAPEDFFPETVPKLQMALCGNASMWIEALANARRTQGVALASPRDEDELRDIFGYINPSDYLGFLCTATNTYYYVPTTEILKADSFEPLGMTKEAFATALHNCDWETLFGLPPKEVGGAIVVTQADIEVLEAEAKQGDLMASALLLSLQETSGSEGYTLKEAFAKMTKKNWFPVDGNSVAGYPLPLPEFVITDGKGSYLDSLGSYWGTQEGKFFLVDKCFSKDPRSLERFFLRQRQRSLESLQKSASLDARGTPKGWFSFEYPRDKDKLPFYLNDGDLDKPLDQQFKGYAKRRGLVLQIIPIGGQAFTCTWTGAVTGHDLSPEGEVFPEIEMGYVIDGEISLTDGGTLDEELAKF